MDYEIVKLLIDILQYNYPETMNNALIISSPFLFHACWAVIRPWLDPVTASKVVFINQKQLADHVILLDAEDKEDETPSTPDPITESIAAAVKSCSTVESADSESSHNSLPSET